MRKLILAVVATSAIASQATAEIRSGFYIGANASANNLLGKGSWSYGDTTANTPKTDSNKSQLGRFGGGLGVYAGYGMLSGCMYYAGELAYDWNAAKAKHSFKSNNTLNNGAVATNSNAKLKLENEHIFNFAALIGRKVNPSTVLYVRLGANVSDVEMHANVFGQKINKSKTRLSFVPGLGMETSFHKNVVGRLEYTCDFANKAKKSFTNAATNETFKASVKNVNTHSVKLGIAYKF